MDRSSFPSLYSAVGSFGNSSMLHDLSPSPLTTSVQSLSTVLAARIAALKEQLFSLGHSIHGWYDFCNDILMRFMMN